MGWVKAFYVLKMVAVASDQVLVDLASHLGFEFVASVSSSLQVACWDDGTADNLAHESFKACHKQKLIQYKLADSLVRLFENSKSFAQSKERIGYLEELEFWDKEFSERVENAVKSNDQVSAAWGVNGRVQELVNKWSVFAT